MSCRILRARCWVGLVWRMWMRQDSLVLLHGERKPIVFGAASRFTLPICRTRWTVRRRISVVAVLALALTVAVPPGAPLPGGKFPLSGLSLLWSWLAQRPAWAAWTGSAFAGVPVQENALGVEAGHEVSAGSTRAGGGAGLDAGSAPGALPADAPLELASAEAAKKPWTTPQAPSGDFDPSKSEPGRGRLERVVGYVSQS